LAIIMKTDWQPDLAEMIDDDVDLFGDRMPSAVVKGSAGNPRWVGPVAAVALLAVVGYNVATSAISAAPHSKADPNLVRPEYFVADAPPGFEMYLAEARGRDGAPAADFPDARPAQLWASDGATATTGSWFVVSQGTHHATGRNSYRTIVNGVEVVFEHDTASHQTRLAFTEHGQPLEITAFGWIDRQLVELVSSINVVDSTVHFDNPFFASDHHHILDGDPATALFGVPVARVGYSTVASARSAQDFTVTVAASNVARRATVTSFALTNVRPSALGDRSAIIGQSSADPTRSVVQWTDGARLITVDGNLGADRLTQIAATVRKGSDDSVQQQLHVRSAQAIPPLQTLPGTIKSGVLDDGRAWEIQVLAANADDTGSGYLWWIAQPSDAIGPRQIRPSMAGAAPAIETMVDHGRTYVVAKAPRSMVGAVLRINPNGLPSTTTPLFVVDPKFADEFTASEFGEPVPFTAQIMDRDGTTVAFWPSL
jgi:hypothetical protein